MAIMGPTSSREPNNAACIRDFPSRTCRSTFSTTTMASSTTKPTDNTMARIVNRFRLKPNAYMKIAAPTNDTGMATNGTKAVRTEPMNRNTTVATIRIVSPSVLVISARALRMNMVPSHTNCMSMSFGRVGRIRSISSRSRCATSISFEPTNGQMPRYTPSVRLYLATISASSAPFSTRATSLSRTMAPPRSVTMRSSNSSVLRRSVLARRLTCTRLPFVRPTAAR